MMSAVQYKSMLDVMGPEAFDEKFKDGKDLLIAPPESQLYQFEDNVDTRKGDIVPTPLQDPSTGLMTRTDVMNINELIPGDWVYFRNYGDYARTHWETGGLWTGEHAAYHGKDESGKMLFSGFGLSKKTFKEMITFMVDARNEGQDEYSQKDFWNKKGDGNDVDRSRDAMKVSSKDVGETVPELDSPYYPGVDLDVKRPNIRGLLKKEEE